MSERLSRSEQEAFWDGHSLEDRCPWKDRRQLEPNPFSEWGLQKRDIGGEVRKIFAEYDALGDKSVIRTFSEGSVFNAQEFPEGSILHIEGDFYRKYSALSPESGQLGNWAVTYGFDRNDRRIVKIVLLEYYDPRRYVKEDSGYFAVAAIDPVIRVGEVSHLKVRGMNLPFGLGRYQNLERFSKVELYGLGKGLRSKATSKPETIWVPGGKLSQA